MEVTPILSKCIDGSVITKENGGSTCDGLREVIDEKEEKGLTQC